jgi:CHAD domain-containing protein
VTDKEVHLTVEPGFRRPSLASSGLLVTASKSAVITAAHYDTKDLRLARWQCTLRRVPRNRWIVGVEGRDVETFRGGDQPPVEAVDFLTAYHRGARLLPLVTLRIATRRLTMQDHGGAVVHVDDERTDSVRNRASGHLRRLTVSAPHRARKPAASVVRLLRDAGAHDGDLGPAHMLAAALEPPAPEVAAFDVSSQSTVADAIRGALGASVTRLIRHDGAVRLGHDAEAVHQARVATRRLRSDLRTFSPLLDERWLADLRRDLSELADDLGRVRDADVLLERLAHAAQDVDDPAAAERVLDVLRADRLRGRRELLGAMERTAYLELLERLIEAASRPRLVRGAGERASTVLPSRVRKNWRKLKRSVQALPAQPSDDQLHMIRIAAKRARYAAEAVAPTSGSEAEHFAEAMADLQTHLGDLHDAVVAAAWLRGQTTSDPREALVIGQLIGMQLERAAELRVTWPDAWRSASDASLRKWMR